MPVEREAEFRTRRGTWAIAAALVLGNFFLHKPVSDVCDALFARIGRAPYEWVMLGGIGALSLAAAFLLARGGAPALSSPRTLLALAGLALLTTCAQQTLLVSNVELIHLPQFGLLAFLLTVAGLPPQTAWLVATFAGALDEAYQWRVIYAHLPNTYFDWNDIVLNAIGAAWSVILLRGGRAGEPGPGERMLQRLLLPALGLGFVVALVVAPPSLAPAAAGAAASARPAPVRRRARRGAESPTRRRRWR